jgi:hypothetical protein
MTTFTGLCSSAGESWEHFLENKPILKGEDWNAEAWSTILENMPAEKWHNLQLKNIHHITWSKKLLNQASQGQTAIQNLDLHSTDLSSAESIEHLMVLLPLGAARIESLNLRWT